eukprot:1218808-Rhodomonas_salina.1
MDCPGSVHDSTAFAFSVWEPTKKNCPLATACSEILPTRPTHWCWFKFPSKVRLVLTQVGRPTSPSTTRRSK